MKDIYDTYLKNQDQKQNLTNYEDTQSVQQDEPIEAVNDIKEPELEIPEIHETAEAVSEIDKLKELEKERDELKDQVLRVAAELENYRRRALKEKREMIDYANERLILNLLPLLDDLGKAVEAGKKAVDCDSMLTGLDLIYQKALKLFENENVKIMENTVGKPFDVNEHEAVMRMPSELPEDYIISEVQSGYTMKDKVLRHAKVVTSAGEPKEEENE
ncbi:MAG: nucleotide exchange factor GrpE [Ignavibacteria bacterium GWB2_35_12]|nr:MAG: nucleotide exchange factor GrpE [Ignavibacteria bacterium GWB2_35_12]OGU96490.1 MAG: nucleotide exchange factor GrpE [Ignavibacteria bacterium RIFOXYA2_FULL_35_10]OGV22942.1 MAG: nucleotide exchange factor GrpE [Ignavibacteria bacterium RIFOXYC2_FULL_35_21]